VNKPVFRDRVRIRTSAVTQAAGVAGEVGHVNGETTPSITGVSVVGELSADYALNVSLERGGEALWFAAELVELIDHAPGTEITIGNKSFVRADNGDWVPAQSKRSWFSRLFGGS
jgi:hypothetical protein